MAVLCPESMADRWVSIDSHRFDVGCWAQKKRYLGSKKRYLGSKKRYLGSKKRFLVKGVWGINGLW
ncbi:hypothetical protein CASFOL_012300 [Castilleja foliolosa]|uniref:Uncharacterized protein n=1 Tax=Castilleja foliolosa TaxID=1961234 RepID=A0ABD3DPZ2_9LAMI